MPRPVHIPIRSDTTRRCLLQEALVKRSVPVPVADEYSTAPTAGPMMVETAVVSNAREANHASTLRP
eukprot:COSAG02_NODE_40569_length_404_cov_0.659016_1_plen_66_part_01